ncbi:MULTISPECIES: class I lanthipeptide [unclassified Flavobacterium]|jgi:translation initiation factor RLI1|uniref:class I lanthipeptide n=1 Tax=unclassified Flavobacterium TaxID=196869 RepID=UPI0014040C2D|nr:MULTISPECIES: class I lanthipeptide [unclassified Flavobacterium]MBP1221924.1 translation initiation factor RLI1 [Flavobacterium sp. 1355]
MKKQNPTNKLAFNKVAVAELNENQMQDVNGGSLISVAVTIALTIIADQVL